MKKKRERKRKEPVQKVQRRRKVREDVKHDINKEFDVYLITQPKGGFTPFPPEDCPSTRFSFVKVDRIKWIDNGLCLKFCPTEKERCASYKMYRDHLHVLMQTDVPKEEKVSKAPEVKPKKRRRTKEKTGFEWNETIQKMTYKKRRRRK